MKRDFFDFQSEADITAFRHYLTTLPKCRHLQNVQKIINTSYPLHATTMPSLRKVAKMIFRGNYAAFLRLNLSQSFEEVALSGLVISLIQHHDKESINYLRSYTKKIDSWALCDLLRFPIQQHNHAQWWSFLTELLNSPLPFQRRTALWMAFSFIQPFQERDYLEDIFNALLNLKEESHYYVNMAAAWLLAECIIQRHDISMMFFENHLTQLNPFVGLKTISKCRDSYRLTAQQKEVLRQLKIERLKSNRTT